MRLARLALLCALAFPATVRAEKTESSMPDNAFLFEARLGGGAPVLFGISGGTGFTAVPSLLLGARLIGRLQIGIGFAFFRLSNTTLFGGAGDLNQVTFAPTVSFDLIKSRDERVALYLKAGLPLGPVIGCPNGGRCDNGFAVGFDFALGARYALHRMFGLGLEAGVQSLFINPQRNDTTGYVEFYGALVGSFWSGR